MKKLAIAALVALTPVAASAALPAKVCPAGTAPLQMGPFTICVPIR